MTTTGSVPLKRVNKSMNRSIKPGNPLHVLRTFFQDFPFSFASTCTLSSISKLNAGSILKVNVCVLIAINKRINTNSNEASWASQWEAAQVLLHV